MSRLLPAAAPALAAGLCLSLTACTPAQLLAGPAVQLPTFEPQSVRLSRLTLPPGEQGTAQLALTVQVRNPNPFPVRLHSFAADLFLTGQPVAHLLLPDVALPARGEAVQVTEASLPVKANGLGELLKVARGQPVPYRLDGTFTADLGALGQPAFGPLTLVQGQWKQAAVWP